MAIGTIATDTGFYERNQAAIETRMDGLLRMFGVDPGGWEAAAVRLTADSPLARDKLKEDIAAIKRGRSIGTFLLDCASGDLDIEGMDDGTGGITLDLALSPDIAAAFSAHGDFWTTREFTNPYTGQVTDQTNSRALLNELQAEYGTVAVDSRADFQLELSVRFSAAQAVDQIAS